MVDLNGVPTFGYETAFCNSYQKNKEELRKNNSQLTDEQIEGLAKATWKIQNVKKGIGYIPVIGSIVGIGRFISLKLPNQKGTIENKTSWTARGVVEALSLGSVFILPDVIATAHRQNKYKNLQQQPISPPKPIVIVVDNQ